MRRAMAFSLLDQALLSAFNLCLSLLLVAKTSPTEFGTFNYVLTVVLVMSSVHNALIATPIGVSLPGRPEAVQSEVLAILLKIDHLLRTATLPIAGGLLILVSRDPLFLGFGLLLCFFWLWRETRRGLAFTRRDARRALMVDAANVLASVLAIAVFWHFASPVNATLAGLAVGNAIAVLLSGEPHATRALKPALRAYRQFWVNARWSLFGAMTTEAQSRGYVFAVQTFRGADALGTLQAGRMLMGPLPLLAASWARVARPEMNHALLERRRGDALRALVVGSFGVLVLSLAYLGALFVCWPLIEPHLFRGRYPEIGTMTAAWGGTTLISLGHICLGTYVQAAQMFRPLAMASLVAALISGLALLALAGQVPLIYALGAVALGESVALVWIVVLVVRGGEAAPDGTREAMS